MQRYMILCEKPSYRNIVSKALGGYEGTFDGYHYIAVASEGHLLGLVDPDKQVSEDLIEKYASWDLENLPWDISDFQWKKDFVKSVSRTKSGKTTYSTTHKRQIYNNIVKVAKTCDAIIMMTDTDPSGEGDMIGWEILDRMGWRKPVFRARPVDEELATCRQALKDKIDISDRSKSGELAKAQGREQFDFSSIQLTRLATTAVRNQGYYALSLPVGRLKSAILDLVYRQIKARENFVKKPFYEIRFKDENNHVFKRKYNDGDKWRFDTIESAKRDLNNYHDASIEVAKGIKKTQEPPALYSLSKLGTAVAHKGFSNASFLSTYQSMYEANIVSYPRTADRKITQAQFDTFEKQANQIAKLLGVDTALLTHRKARKKFITKKADHGANRPGSNIPKSMDDLERQYGKVGRCIYEILGRECLAMLAEDYVYERINARLSPFDTFTSTINVPVNLNFKAVLNEAPEKPESFGTVAKPFVYEGSNTPPAKPTQDMVVSYLNRHHIGTGATQQTTITDISSSKGKKKKPLLNIKGKQLEITLTDLGLMDAAVETGTMIASPNVTKQLFDLMDKAGKFEYDARNIPYLINQIYKHDYPIVMKNSKNLEALTGIKKPEKKEKIEAIYHGKKIYFNKSWGGHDFTQDEIDQMMQDIPITFQYVTKKGEKQSITGKIQQGTYNKHKYWGFQSVDTKKE